MNLRTRALKGLLGTSIVTLAASGLVGATMTGAEAAKPAGGTATLTSSSPATAGDAVLTCTAAGFTNSPTSYSFTITNDSDDVVASSGFLNKTKLKYVTDTDDVADFTCKVIAKNADGQTSRNSNTVTVSAPAAPSDPPTTGAPQKSDSDQVTVVVDGSTTPAPTPTNFVAGTKLRCLPGTWAPAATTYTYKWTRDSSEIKDATLETFTLTTADKGHTIACSVAGHNASGGSGTVPSGNGVAVNGPAEPSSTPANPSAPYNQVAPSLREGNPAGTAVNTGVKHDATGTLGCNPGIWKADPGKDVFFYYTWTRNSAPIKGETSQNYVLSAADKGARVTCRVVAYVTTSNAPGDSNAFRSGEHPATDVAIKS